MNLNTLTLTETIKKLKAKEISHTELYRDLHKEISEKNEKLNIYLTLDNEALAKAEKLLETPLAGAPIAVKDNYLTSGIRTTASSNVLNNFVPPSDATVITKLKSAGGVVLGKTNMDAWAHGSSTETSDFGPTKNPRNPAYLPGGSSGGSAAAVAADMTIAALGTETAGSIRQPSAWCGVVGLKPTYGRVSRSGIVAMASSTDSPGPIGKTVEDCALLLNYIAGKDPYDATTSPQPVPDFTKHLKKGVKGLHIGICYEHIASVEPAAKKLIELGATVDIAPAMSPEIAIAVYTVVQRSEVSSNLARYDGIRYGNDRSTFGEEAKRRIMLGTFTLTKGYADRYYIAAQKVRSLYVKNYQELFRKYDLLISPTSPGYALKLGASAGNPMFGELEDMLVEPSSLSGLPGINVPWHRDPKTNLYLGLNIVGNYWAEEKILQAAYAFELATKL
jgi:aspartyl-tRNA(Asn)/glutamyl-tRNA(Gln) amidotransferase subunit A